MSFRDGAAAYFLRLMQNSPKTWYDKIILAMMTVVSRIYEKGVLYRFKAYKDGTKNVQKLPATVISLGNITIGGTGKTPTACLLAGQLFRAGYKVAVLNRGYRSQQEHGLAVMSDGRKILLTAEEGGDEACLMARQLPGVPIIVGSDRVAAGKLAIEQFGAQILLLDDAYQHWKVARDLDIVLIDATNPFGNGHVLPRGILREPLFQLDRAGLFFLTKADMKTQAELDVICRDLRRYNKTAPIITSAHATSWCIPFTQWISGGGHFDAVSLPQPSQQALTVCALGNPEGFEETVRLLGFTVIDRLRFSDHHQYTKEDIVCIGQQAKMADAVIVITEKDAVKFPVDMALYCEAPVYVVGIEIKILSGEELMKKTIRRVLGG